MKKKLKHLEKKFGGKVTSNFFGKDYILDDIEVKYEFGTQYQPMGSTEIKITNQPKKSINLEISSKFKNRVHGQSFKDLYEYKCIAPKEFNFITEDIKKYLVENFNCDINLTINRYEFFLSTMTSPMSINKLEKCIEFVLMIKERILELESEKQATL